MKRIYQKLARRRAFFVARTKTAISTVDNRDVVIAAVGFVTFFFGFGAGALLNLYLLASNHPLVTEFRSTLTYTSAVIGDGVLLPLVNMVAVAFLLKNARYIGKELFQGALLLGIAITVWFHVSQAVQGLINWAMPTPWHWNILGFWHAIYMFSVASLLSLFYLISIKVMKEEKEVSMQVMVVTAGLLAFFILLHLDYPSSLTLP